VEEQEVAEPGPEVVPQALVEVGAEPAVGALEVAAAEVEQAVVLEAVAGAKFFSPNMV
jgi:hypothetical protein